MVKLLAIVLLLTVTSCGMGPRTYAPSAWTKVPFEQAKAECFAQLNRDDDAANATSHKSVTATFASSLVGLQEVSPRMSRCLNGYGYVAVK